MSEEFEAVIIYKDGGPFQRKGGTFDAHTARSQEELDEKLASGWYSHPDQIGAAPAPAQIKEPESNDAPTRDELELKAKELKIKFSDKTTDEELGKLIAAKLG